MTGLQTVEKMARAPVEARMARVTDAIDRMGPLASALRCDSHRALFDWLDDCSGLTMRHLTLFDAQREIGWALENLTGIKAIVDAACAEARRDAA